MHDLLHDARLALRSLRQRPGFSLLAVLTLSLGLGATTAIFTVVKGVLLEPLDYVEPERLVVVMEKNPSAGFPRFSLSPLNFRDYREMNGTLEFMAASSGASLAHQPADGGAAQRWRARSVTHDFLKVFAVQPLHGRDFRPEDDAPGAAPTVLLGYELWQKLGADPGLVGEHLRIEGEATEVIGVMPQGFFRDRDAFVPLRIDYEQTSRGGHWLLGYGRLAEGVSIDTARADLERVGASLEAEYPDSNTGWGSLVHPLHGMMVENIERALWVLFAAVGVVLLIACANVANLTLTRLAQREREVAVQTALGAPRWRILRQMLVESLMVAGAAGLLGLGLARYGVTAILALDADSVPRSAEIGLDGGVLAFGFGLTVLTAVLFGLVPALQTARPDLAGTIKEGGRGHAGGRRGQRLRQSLVLGEVALALMLSIAGGLLVRSYGHLLDVDPGFDAGKIWTASFSLPEGTYGEEPARAAFFEKLLDRAAGLPGVEKVATVAPMPLSGGDYILTFAVEGRPIAEPNQAPNAAIRFIAGDYFDAMGIPVLRGRGLDRRDREGAQQVVAVNQAGAETFWPDQDPIGSRITFGDPEDEEAEWATVVGIVGDVRHAELGERPDPAFYRSALQHPNLGATVVIRSAGDPGLVATPLRSTMAELDPSLPLFSQQAGTDYLGQSLAEPRFNTTLLSTFAVLALVLAAIGVFGVISFTVAQQMREIGVRLALGAGIPRIVRWVVLRGFAPVAWGILLGLGGAVLATRLLQSLVYGVPTLDPITFLGVAVGLAAVALLACLVPALKASRVEPVIVLRDE